MPLLNIRVSAPERIKLKALAQTGGFKNLSQFVRHQLGLSTEAKIDADAVPEKEVLDLEHILPMLVDISQRLAVVERGATRIAKSLGVDTSPAPTVHPDKSLEGFDRG